MRHATQARFDRWAAWRLKLRAACLAAIYSRVPLLAGFPGCKHFRESPKMEELSEQA
jgi:hypothetical protein